MALILAVVLLPLTVISVAKSIDLSNEIRARSEAALIGETMRASSGELRYIQQARGAAQVLAEVVLPLAGDVDTCSELLVRIADSTARYTSVSYIDERGRSFCNSESRELDYSDDSLFLQGSQDQRVSLTVTERGNVSLASVLVITHPVFDGGGTYRGLVSLSLPHSGLLVAQDSPDRARNPLTVITFDADGTILTASPEMDDIGIAVPRDRALAALAGQNAVSFSGPSIAGNTRVFSVVPLVPDELYALGSWPPTVDAKSAVFDRAPVLLPALMWLASVMVAWLAVQRLVIRYILKLRNSMKSFASGKRLVGDISVEGAPLELREMSEAYATMTDAVIRDEAELEDAVHQKEVLLREVHHRVKNNLQLIASIMNMQIRHTPSDETKQIMRGLQHRVMSLATIHRELYQTTGRSDIHAPDLLSSIVQQIGALGDVQDRRGTVRTEFDEVRLTPDQAVPLGLLVAEALSSAMQFANGADGATPDYFVSFKLLEGRLAMLTVGNSTEIRDRHADDEAGGTAGEGLGNQLISAFAAQLGGKVERYTGNGSFDVRVTFPISPLADGEERHSSAPG